MALNFALDASFSILEDWEGMRGKSWEVNGMRNVPIFYIYEGG
jgi:hypothetical protein